MLRRIHEIAPPQQGEAHLLGVEREVDLFRVAHRDRPRAGALDEVAVDQGLVDRHQRNGLGPETRRDLRPAALREILPERLDLALRGAVEDVLAHALPLRPVRRHPGAGPERRRIQQVLSEPVAPQALAHVHEIHALDAERLVVLERVAGDTGHPLRAGEQAAGLDQVGIARRRGGRKRPVGLLEIRRECPEGRGSEDRHPRHHVRTDLDAAAQKGLKPLPTQLAAHPVQVRRNATLIAHVVAAGDEERVALRRRAAAALPLVAGIAVQRRHRPLDPLRGGRLLHARQGLEDRREGADLGGVERELLGLPRQASALALELGQRPGREGLCARHAFMTGGAALRREQVSPLLHERRVRRERRPHGRRLADHRRARLGAAQRRGRDLPLRDAGPFILDPELRAAAALEEADREGVLPRLEGDRAALFHPAVDAVVVDDERRPDAEHAAVVRMHREAVDPVLGDIEVAAEAQGVILLLLRETDVELLRHAGGGGLERVKVGHLPEVPLEDVV